MINMIKKRDFIIILWVGDEKMGKEICLLKLCCLVNRKCGGCILVCFVGYVDLNGFLVFLSVNELLFEWWSEVWKFVVIIFILNRFFKVLKGLNMYIDFYWLVFILVKVNVGI